jgi:uncharacterized membrane protein
MAHTPRTMEADAGGAQDPRAPSPRVDPTAENVRTIAELERRSVRERRWSEAISDQISRVAGSLTFVGFHLALFCAWAAWNALAPAGWRFDPYPYGLLTFIVSLEGVLIATFVLISQNRMSQNAERRDHLHLQVGLLAEQELTLTLRLLRRIADRLEVSPESDEAARATRLAAETNVYELMERIKRELPSEPRADGN